MPQVQNLEKVRIKEDKYHSNQTLNYNQRHRTRILPTLQQGDVVWIRDQAPCGQVVVGTHHPRSYISQTDNGRMISIGGFFDCRKFIQSWLLNYYYLVDAVCVIMFTAGAVLRHYPGMLDAARIVLSLTLVTFYIRLLHIFSVNKHLGPKLIMIIKMMNDLVVFMCILMVFLLAYGIACQAVLFPHVTDTRQMLKGIFYRSYFQIYGELFLEELEGRNDCSNEDPTMEPCPANTWFGTTILAVYLFISNVLLLNLLIAMLKYDSIILYSSIHVMLAHES
eukprot:XP_003731577.2 PREDICTED: transient receptor potential cation channel subfamily M member 5 [Strongylocentrotus purpuratus]